MKLPQNKSYILYIFLSLSFCLCVVATYYNLVVLKNFTQFGPDEEPSPFDFYIHEPDEKL
jgi:hypothetical protein